MKKAGATAWVRARIGGQLGWWPAESTRYLRSGRVECCIAHRGRALKVIVHPDFVSHSRPIGV